VRDLAHKFYVVDLDFLQNELYDLTKYEQSSLFQSGCPSRKSIKESSTSKWHQAWHH
jgi:hypothetical protein